MPRVSENIIFNETWRLWMNQKCKKQTAEQSREKHLVLNMWRADGTNICTSTSYDNCLWRLSTDRPETQTGGTGSSGVPLCLMIDWTQWHETGFLRVSEGVPQGPISGLVSFFCFCINNIVRTCFRLKAPLCRWHGAEMCFSCRSHWRFFSKCSEISQRWCFPFGGDLRKYLCIRVNDALLFRVLYEHLVENLKKAETCLFLSFIVSVICSRPWFSETGGSLSVISWLKTGQLSFLSHLMIHFWGLCIIQGQRGTVLVSRA